MSDFTQPLYSAPIVLDGTETITVTMGGGSTSSNFSVGPAGDATLTASTYYNHILTDTGGLSSFAYHIAYTLSEADFAVNAAVGDPAVTPNWTVTTAGSGLSFRLVFTRAGLTGDNIASIAFGAGLGGTTHFGSSEGNTVTDGSGEMSSAADDTTITFDYQRGYVWLPREILTYDTQIPVATRAIAITNYGGAVVDGYGSYSKREHRIEYVHGALVYQDKSTDTQSLGFAANVTGLTAGDSNAPLETFWAILGANAGAAPVVKYLPDSGTLTNPQDMVFADKDWLESMDSVAEVMTSSPLLYRVTMRGQDSV